jgi:hypothetical protein
MTTDARWYRDDLLVVWQWTPGNLTKPLKSLVIEQARALATWNEAEQIWEVRGRFIFPGYHSSHGSAHT